MTGSKLKAFVASGAHAFLPRRINPQNSRLVAAAAIVGFVAAMAPEAAEAHWQGHQGSSGQSGQTRTWTPPPQRTVVVQPAMPIQSYQQQNYQTYQQQPLMLQQTVPSLGAAYPTYQYGAQPRPLTPMTSSRPPSSAFAYAPSNGQDGRANPALVQAARIAAAAAGVDPAVLLSFHDRALPALALGRARMGRDDPAAPVGGPFGLTQQRWLGALHRVGAEIPGLEAVSAAIVRSPDGQFRIEDRGLYAQAFAARSAPRTAFAVAAVEMSRNIALFDERAGTKPTLADLYVAHHGGAGMMLRFAKAAAEGQPLVGALLPNQARDLSILAGMPGTQGITAAAFSTQLSDALRRSVAAYAPRVATGPQMAPGPASPSAGIGSFQPEEEVDAPSYKP